MGNDKPIRVWSDSTPDIESGLLEALSRVSELLKAVEQELAGVHSIRIDVAMEDVMRLCECVAQSRPHYLYDWRAALNKQTSEMKCFALIGGGARFV
jgi:hypothetical protein